ncbi:MAG: UDP-N-acetylglucosamine--N-acetylmuramyl-(pentapeptide) pyrophosphoryl-undecaprenol N-acetylglucosamine transferase [Lentisphaerae bacterium]|nr:UDP-N-acetylglucosamine--N-acetylmuramyl-(pentapeptide) pyrophosphoryl-undecaprenol N-acetylglucosamine transferase [Lentisphaerota bacterium]
MTEHLVITCGGTGGHFYPGLSVARTQQARGKKVLLLLSGKNSLEQAKIAEKFQIRCITLPHMPSPSIKHPGNCWRFFKGLLSGVVQARKILKTESPDAVLGMGSFASLPVITAARLLKLPIFLHDGNARIGKANRILSRWAQALATAFPAVNADKVRCPYSVSGMPLRPELKQHKLSKAEAIEALNQKFDCQLSAAHFTILLFGGSQGARKLNEVFGTVIRQLAEKYGNIQLIHLTGAGEYASVAAFHAEEKYPLLQLPGLSEMHWAYNAADLVIARSGGSSVAEINAFGKYAVVVPYPYAAELHQDDNADYLVTLQAACKLDNDSLSEAQALELLEKLYRQADLAQLGADSVQPEAWQGAENLLMIIDSTGKN